MINIIPASDMTQEKMSKVKNSDDFKLALIDNLKGMISYRAMIERLVFLFVYHVIPAHTISNHRTCRYTIYPSDYGLSPWAVDAHTVLVNQAINESLIHEMEPYGYKVAVDNFVVNITW